MFKRREHPPMLQRMGHALYPKGGWRRAFYYVTYRVRRLPDTPERIARGIWAGVFTAFTPFYGLHFVIAFLISRVMRGNALAALAGTFFGNPLTYVPIGIVSLQTGYWLLGAEAKGESGRSFGGKFVDAWHDLKFNIKAFFNHTEPDWHGLGVFYHEVFYPYMIGGLIPGVITASICYYLSVPLIRAYKQRRLSRIRTKFKEIKEKAQTEADLTLKAD